MDNLMENDGFMGIEYDFEEDLKIYVLMRVWFT